MDIFLYLKVAKASDIVGHLASQVNPMSQSGPSGHAKEDDDTKEGTKQQGDTEDHARIEGMELVAPTQNLSQGLDVKMQDPDSKTAHQRTQGGAGDELYSETLPDDGNMPIRAIGTQSRKDVGAETCNGISGPETQQREGTRMSIKQSEKDRTVPATPGNKKSQVENEKKDTSVALPVEKDTVKETTKGRGKRGRPKKIPSKETKRNDKKLKNNDGLKAKPEVVPPVEQARAETSQKETLVKPTAKRGRPKKEAPSPDIRESGKQGQNEGARVKSGRKRGIQETELKPSSKAKQSRSQQGNFLSTACLDTLSTQKCLESLFNANFELQLSIENVLFIDGHITRVATIKLPKGNNPYKEFASSGSQRKENQERQIFRRAH